MNIKQIVGVLVGVVILAIGVYFMKSGYSAMDGTKERLKHKITGSYSSETKSDIRVGMTLVVVGVVVAAGLVYYFRCKRKAH